ALVLSLALVGCGSDSAPSSAAASSASAETASNSNTVYETALEEDPCALLTVAMVSEVAGVPDDALDQIAISGMCSYSWDATDTYGAGTAALRTVEVLEDQEAASSYFAQAYRQLTDEERAQAEAAIAAQVEAQRAEGEVTDEQAEMADGFASLAAGMQATVEYQPVEGIGDQALYDGTLRTMNIPMIGDIVVAETSLHVRDGNLIVTVGYDGFDAGEDMEAMKAGPSEAVQADNMAKSIALARAILAELE
ncbi:MAG: hypothetical protein AAF809_14800, partial [Bacteroidota bacterium]